MKRLNFVRNMFPVMIVFIFAVAGYPRRVEKEGLPVQNNEKQDAALDISVGASIPLGKGSDAFNTGILVDVAPYLSVSPNVYLGFKVRYNSWSVNKDGLRKEIETLTHQDVNDAQFDATGEFKYFSISPTLRFQSAYIEEASFYGMLSFGAYLGVSSIETKMNSITMVSDTSSLDLGVAFSGGVLFPVSQSLKISLGLDYNLVFTKDENTTFIDPKIAFMFFF